MPKRILRKILVIFLTELIIAVVFTSLFIILLGLRLKYPKTPFSYGFIMLIWAVCAIAVPLAIEFAESRIRKRLAHLNQK